MICVERVVVSPDSIVLKVGEWFYNAKAYVYPTNATDKEVVWSSGKPSVASVNETNGYIRANSVGTTKIYARAVDGSGEYGYVLVEVTDKVKVSSVCLNKRVMSLEKGHKKTLTATVCPENASDKSLRWCSSDETVATVIGGEVTGKKAGMARITAVANDGTGEYDFCNVYVEENILPTWITVNATKSVFNIGDTDFLCETVYPENATNKKVTWSSSAPNVVFVNPTSGMIIAKGEGEATITATANADKDIKGHYNIRVNPPVAVAGVDVCPESLTMNVGDTRRLTACIKPTNATNQKVTWCSNNQSVACVDAAGNVYANRAGTAFITATTEDGEYADCCRVQVLYCGGENFRDVTKHTMILQSDGYYVCSKCGYRVKSPELEDYNVLSFQDYLFVISAQQLYVHYEHIIRSNSIAQMYTERQDRIDKIISSIRRKDEYKWKYQYSDANGNCYGPEPVDNYQNTLYFKALDIEGVLEYNGIVDMVHSLILGYYSSSKIIFIKDILDFLNSEMDVLDFTASAADVYGFSKISAALTIASGIAKFSESDIEVGDICVRIGVLPYVGHYIYSPTGRLKKVKIELRQLY